MNLINNSIGGIFYEIFWCLLIFLFYPLYKPWKIVLLVFLTTVMLEFLQLWHPDILENVRSNFFGRTLIGNAFSWKDFPFYIVGTLAGLIWLKRIQKIGKERA